MTRRALAVAVAMLAACAHHAPPPAAPTPPPRTVAPDPSPPPPSERALRFDAIVAAAPTPTAAFFAAQRELGDDPALHTKLAMLGERAADLEIEHARAAKGPGAAWLHAALAARIAGGKPPRRAAAALDAVTLPDFDLFPPPASCSWLGGPARQPTGRHVEVSTTNLSCQLTPDGAHARAHISGSATLRWNDGEWNLIVAIDSASAPAAVLQLHTELTLRVRHEWAAGHQRRVLGTDPAEVEDSLIILARLGLADPDQLAAHMLQFGVTFAVLDTH